MKVTILEKSVEEDEINFPILMIHDESRVVVLFIEDMCGTVVDRAISVYSLGEFRIDWRMDGFSKFSGQVILEND